MSEILRYTHKDSPRDVVSEDGDVLPYSNEEVESAQDLQDALEMQEWLYLDELDANSDTIDSAVMDALHDAALREHDLRSAGVSQTRIKKLAHIPLNQTLIQLQRSGHDISAAFVPAATSEQDTLVSSSSAFTAEEAREAKIEHLVDTMGISYEEAEKRV